ncbi:hypothetical protein EDD36DRAFT_442987 [Exophiala viscosa]|uniref:Uncharacterized protein n=1 Tax=Exophiala viscosa TaxID=2486360 RepID=A0AAN6DS17_9EURO|nr:hypothetical protein EDD36DRAFT_442987 [Exophiala viscosa]
MIFYSYGHHLAASSRLRVLLCEIRLAISRSLQQYRPGNTLGFMTEPTWSRFQSMTPTLVIRALPSNPNSWIPLLHVLLSTTLHQSNVHPRALLFIDAFCVFCLTSTPCLMRLLPLTCLFRPSDCLDCVMAIDAGVYCDRGFLRFRSYLPPLHQSFCLRYTPLCYSPYFKHASAVRYWSQRLFSTLSTQHSMLPYQPFSLKLYLFSVR